MVVGPLGKKNMVKSEKSHYKSKKNINLKREAVDFDLIYKERFENMKSILINNERVEDYFYKNPWRYSFSREYAFGSILRDFRQVKGKRKGLRILDIGCGNGWFSLNANINNIDHWDCIDISSEAIAVANKYKKRTDITKNSYRIEKLESFRGNKKYDIITCVNTLHHLTNLNLFYSKIKDYLKPGGKIFIHDVSPDLFLEMNGIFVLLIRKILRFTDKVKYFEDFKTSDIQVNLKKIIYEWQNETDDLKQSHHDHYHSTPEIVSFLRNKFVEVSYKQQGGILMRLLGGLRGDMFELKRLARELIAFEKLLIDRRLITPYNYTFIGKIK